ncbi:hypothetical protein [Enterococcus casseliflavus]|uniref:hypothetical protein n=1 Tax=Enterococcus casseliflavus TaxID=37734 RepID=UPI0037CA6FF7
MEIKRSSIEKMSEGIGLFFQGIVDLFSDVVSVISKVVKQIDWEMLSGQMPQLFMRMQRRQW